MICYIYSGVYKMGSGVGVYYYDVLCGLKGHTWGYIMCNRARSLRIGKYAAGSK